MAPKKNTLSVLLFLFSCGHSNHAMETCESYRPPGSSPLSLFPFSSHVSKEKQCALGYAPVHLQCSEECRNARKYLPVSIHSVSKNSTGLHNRCSYCYRGLPGRSQGRPLHFIHVPKTAGSSVEKYIASAAFFWNVSFLIF